MMAEGNAPEATPSGGEAVGEAGQKRADDAKPQRTRRNRNRNRGRWRQDNVNKQHHQPKEKFAGRSKELKGFVYDIVGACGGVAFKKTTDEIARHVGEKYPSIGTYLRTGILSMTVPIPQQPNAPIASGTPPVVDPVMQEIFKEEIRLYVKTKSAIVTTMQAVYELIWGQCSDTLRSRLRGDKDFDTYSKAADTIELLKAIRAEMTGIRKKQYLPHALHTTMMGFYGITQGRHKSNQEYYDEFDAYVKSAEENGATIGSHPSGVTEILNEEAADPANPTAAERQSAIAQATQRYLAVAFLWGADKVRFGSLMEDIENEFFRSKGSQSTTGTYPSTVAEAYDYLCNYTKDPKHIQRLLAGQGDLATSVSFALDAGRQESHLEEQSGEQSFATTGSGGTRKKVCNRCGIDGHTSIECNTEQAKVDAFRQTKQGNQGVSQLINAVEWDGIVDDEAPNFVFVNKDSMISSGETRCTEHDSRGTIRGVYKTTIFSQANAGIPDTWYLLDNQSTCDIVSNPKLVTNIRKVEGYMQLSTQAGSTTTNWMADVPGYYRPVWFHPGGIANILSLSNVIAKYRVTFDSQEGSHPNEFCVHKGDGTIRRFKQSVRGLYYLDTAVVEDHAVLAVSTIEKNKSRYSARDYSRAQLARKLQILVGRPELKDFVRYIDHNLIPNCPITRQDAINAHAIFGRDLGSIKGKTTRQTVDAVRASLVDIPLDIMSHYRDIILCVDIMFVNKIPFLVSISRDLRFITASVLNNRKQSSLVKGLKEIHGVYTRRGFRIRTVLADSEFECTRGSIASDLHADLNTCGEDEHIPDIERCIRTIKERTRCTYTVTPFDHFPPRLIIEMVFLSIFWLNAFPHRLGVSPLHSPRTIVTGLSIDYTKHCRVEFGQYVQTHEKHDNTMRTRTVGALALRPTGNQQGGYYFYSLASGLRLHRTHWTELPMPAEVRDRVHALARRAKATRGLLFTDSAGQLFPDPDDTDSDLDPSDSDSEDPSSTHSDGDSDNDSDFVPDDSSTASDISLTSDDDHAPAILPGGPAGVGAAEGAAEEATDMIDDQNAGVNAERPPEEARDLQADNDLDGESTGVDSDYLPDLDDESTGVDSDHDPTGSDDDTTDDNNATSTGIEPGPSRTSRTTGVDPDTDLETYVNELEAELDQEIAALDSDNDLDDQLANSTREQTHADTLADDGSEASNNEPLPRLRRNRTLDYSHLKGRAGDGSLPTVARPNEFKSGQHIAHLIMENIVMTQYNLKQGIKRFGDKGKAAVLKELRQIYDRDVMEPIDKYDLTPEERKNALRYLMFLKEKRCGVIKGRGCADGRSQRDYMTKEETSAPTAANEAILLTCVIDAIEGRDSATSDIPGAFMQSKMKSSKGRVVMKLEGVLAELIKKLDPKQYEQYVVIENGKEVIYVVLKKALYGTLQAALLFWQNLSSQLQEWGFVINPYDFCVANKTINNKQCTIVWHVDDLKISHVDPAVVTSVLEQLDKRYGQEIVGGERAPITVTRGKIHDYLGMTLDYTEKGAVKIDMTDYVNKTLGEMPEDMDGTATTPAADYLFDIKEGIEELNNEKSDFFHSTVAKLLFLCKRGRPDIMTAIAFLCTRVQSPTRHDYNKLARVIKYLRGTKNLVLKLSADNLNVIKWWVDASYAVHGDMKSHTGGAMSIGTGAVYATSRKQKLNTKSSTEAELVGVDDVLPQALWTKYFLEAQGYGTDILLHQDNQSTIKLAENGRASSGKGTRHINIRYFFITDRIAKKEVAVQYCPTKSMVADYFTKPLQGELFYKFRDQIMGVVPMATIQGPHRSVLDKTVTKKDETSPNPNGESCMERVAKRVKVGTDVRQNESHKTWADVVDVESRFNSYCCGRQELSEATLQDIITNASTIDDSLAAYQVLIQLKEQQKKNDAAVDISLRVLEELGVPMPKSNLMGRSLYILWQLRSTYPSQEDIDRIAAAHSPHNDAVVLLLLELARISMGYSSLGLTLYSMLLPAQMVLAEGSGRQGAAALMGIACAFAAVGDIKTATRFGEIGDEVTARTNNRNYRIDQARARVGGDFFVIHWTRCYNQVMESTLASSKVLMECGRVDVGLLALYSYGQLYFCAGLNLFHLKRDIEQALRTAEVCNLQEFELRLSGFVYFILKLTGERPDPNDEAKILESWRTPKNSAMLARELTFRMFSSYLFGDIDKAKEWEKEFRKESPDPDPFAPYRVLLQGLIACHRADRSWKSRRTADKALNTLEKYCKLGNPNAIHMMLLLKAERMATRQHKPLEVRNAFDEAIRSAGREGVTSLQALANERAGVYFLNCAKDNSWATTYFSRARVLYQDWGAFGKANHMAVAYSKNLLEPSTPLESRKSSAHRSRQRVTTKMLNPSEQNQRLVMEGILDDE